MSFRFCMYTTKKAEGQAWISVVWFTQSQSLVSITKIIVLHVSQKPWAEHHGLLNCHAPAVAEGGASGHKVEFRTVPLLHGHELMWVKTIKYIWIEESRVLTLSSSSFLSAITTQHNTTQPKLLFNKRAPIGSNSSPGIFSTRKHQPYFFHQGLWTDMYGFESAWVNVGVSVSSYMEWWVCRSSYKQVFEFIHENVGVSKLIYGNIYSTRGFVSSY